MNTTSPVVCPKCGYVRTANEVAPEWQCPSCGIAYNKYQAYLKRAHRLVAPLKAGHAPPRATADTSIWSLFIANAITLAAAIYYGWDARPLMLVYWTQSVFIGISYYRRIMSLEKFSTRDLSIDGRQVKPTYATKVKIASIFTFGYGVFHLCFFLFIVLIVLSDDTHVMGNLFGFLLCVIAFAINHVYSYRYNRDVDRRGTPNIGTMMITPFIRIIPMHIAIGMGIKANATTETLALFVGLKTIADVGMHILEHKRIRIIVDVHT